MAQTRRKKLILNICAFKEILHPIINSTDQILMLSRNLSVRNVILRNVQTMQVFFTTLMFMHCYKFCKYVISKELVICMFYVHVHIFDIYVIIPVGRDIKWSPLLTITIPFSYILKKGRLVKDDQENFKISKLVTFWL